MSLERSSFNLSKQAWCSSVQVHFALGLVSSQREAATVAKPGMYLEQYWAIQRKLLHSDAFAGGLASLSALTFFGSDDVPSGEKTDPKNSSVVLLNRHFDRLRVRFLSPNCWSTASRALSCSSWVAPKIIMSSLMFRHPLMP